MAIELLRGHLVYFMACLVHFSGFGMLYQEKIWQPWREAFNFSASWSGHSLLELRIVGPNFERVIGVNVKSFYLSLYCLFLLTDPN
jgi:hypothetical protein